MGPTNRVSWRDGILLAPQHFQQADRAVESRARRRQAASGPPCWGVQELAWEEGGICQGRLELRRLRAILPDGELICAPDVDLLPPARAFELPSSGKSLAVYVGIPTPRPEGPLGGEDVSRGDLRFVERSLDMADEFEPERMERLRVLGLNLRLILGGESQDGLACLKVAELIRTAEGTAGLRPEHIPAVLRIQASPALMRLGRELQGQVMARARSLSEERRLRGGEAMEVNANDLPRALYLMLLQQQAPVLQALLEEPGTHPLRLYEELLRLAGGLSTFDVQGELSFPPYAHDALATSFGPLGERLRQLLAQLFTTRYEVVPLSKREGLWVGQIGNMDVRQAGALFLAVSGELAPAELISKVPNAVKLAELDSIERLIRTHVGGIRLVHVLRPPAPVPARAETLYFRLVCEGGDWEKLAASGRVAVYVPSWLPGLKLELVGLRAREVV